MLQHNLSLQQMGLAWLLLASTFGCGRQNATQQPMQTPGEPVPSKADESSTGISAMNFKLNTGAFNTGGGIPREKTGEGGDGSPPPELQGGPDKQEEYALICDDPDAPTPEPWVHWVIYGIPADVRKLPEGVK